MIVFSDLHLREGTEDVVFNDVLPGITNKAVLLGEKTLVCLGDFWHLRYKISVRLQNRVFSWLSQLENMGVDIIFLPGNHDQIDVTGSNALEVFSALPNVTVHTQPTVNQYGLWIPYRRNIGEVVAALALAKDPQFPGVIWMHQGVVGSWINAKTQDTDGISLEQLSGKIVFCGHYHTRQQVQNVIYIGSPYQTTAGEAGQEKGYAIINPKDWSVKWVNPGWGRKYHNLGLVNLNTCDFSQVNEGDEIRAIVPAGEDVSAVVKSLSERGIRCVTTPQVEDLQSRLEVSNVGSLGEYARAYTTMFRGELDGERLLRAFSGITGETI